MNIAALREKLYQFADEITNAFDEQEARIKYLQDQINEDKKKEKEFLISLASLIGKRLGE